MAGVLEVDRVSFGYGGTPVLRDVSLRVDGGELVAIVGANGSGKTTLVKLAVGLLRPAKGTVRILGVDIGRLRDRSAIGYVPQRAVAVTRLPISVEEVVATGLAAQVGLLKRPSPRQRMRTEQVMDLLGLTAVRGRPVATLSGGQQQRALIARALVTAPRLLVLDEPTTGVDADAREALRDSLEHLVRREGVAVIYISHDPEGFAGLANRVLEMRYGALAADGVRS